MRLLAPVVLATVALLTGCAQIASHQALTEEAQLARRMLDRFASEPAVSQLEGKVWTGEINDAPIRYFTNKDRVSEPDKPALEKLAAINNQNSKDYEDFIKRNAPHQISILEALRSALFANFMQLYEGKLTYGEYNTQRRAVVGKAREAFAERNREAAMRQSEANSQALNSYLNFLATQSLISAQQQSPIITAPSVNYEIYVPPPLNVLPPERPGVIRR